MSSMAWAAGALLEHGSIAAVAVAFSVGGEDEHVAHVVFLEEAVFAKAAGNDFAVVALVI
jgi:hypothetical protein